QTVEFICKLCGQVYLLRSLYEAHLGSRVCQERRQINRTRAAIEREGWKPLGTNILLPEILKRAEIKLKQGPVDYDGVTRQPIYGSYGPQWAVESAITLSLGGWEPEEIVRLLKLGAGNG